MVMQRLDPPRNPGWNESYRQEVGLKYNIILRSMLIKPTSHAVAQVTHTHSSAKWLRATCHAIHKTDAIEKPISRPAHNNQKAATQKNRIQARKADWSLKNEQPYKQHSNYLTLWTPSSSREPQKWAATSTQSTRKGGWLTIIVLVLSKFNFILIG